MKILKAIASWIVAIWLYVGFWITVIGAAFLFRFLGLSNNTSAILITIITLILCIISSKLTKTKY